MIITCEECHTKFRVDEKKINSEGSKAECSICKNIFTIYPNESDNGISSETEHENEESAFQESEHKNKKGKFFVAAIILIVIALGITFILKFSGVEISSLKEIQYIGKILDKMESISDDHKIKIRVFDIVTDIIDNNKSGKLFVITGKAENNYPYTQSYIRVTANLYTADNILAKTKDVFCGNIISKQDLSELGIDKIDEILNNPLGNNGNSTEVKPNESIPFVVAFDNFPEHPEKFAIEVKEFIKK